MITTFIVTVEIYYRWQIDIKQSFKQVFKLTAQKIGALLCKRKQEVEIEGGQIEGEGDGEEGGVEALKSDNRQSIFQLFEMYRKEGLCPPKHKVHCNFNNIMFKVNSTSNFTDYFLLLYSQSL